jgi:hypothetical protein
MRKAMSRAAALPFLIGLAALSVSGCSTSQSGTASPVSSDNAPPSASSSGSATGQPSVAAIDPCGILTAADLAQFGSFNPGKPQTPSGARSCAWDGRIVNASDPAFAVRIDVRDTAGINDGPAGDSAEVNGRPAVQSSLPAAGDCAIRLKMTDKSRVDVDVTGLVDKACDVASKLAYIVEPRLPK